MIKVVIFDVDGVLFNTDELYFQYLQQALVKRGVEITEEFFTYNGYDDCIYELGLSEKLIQDVLQNMHTKYYHDDILQGVHIKDGVLSTLKGLSSSLQIATGSGEKQFQIERYLRHYAIDKYFSFIGHGALVEGKKSNPEYFYTIANHFGVLPQECLHIGDNLYDQNGLAAGVNVAIIPTKYSTHIDFDQRCHMLNSISDIPELITALSTLKT
ncbi:HAD family phosphatase [Patescibacteria group bacterium]|nr:HAD family phosphatase [Patescibacteria group bacterium]MBU1123163.1 HAD family phosphatase [Patescibacteria group bacterium]MBU1911886.1 HAD family phosphatase [Patescibacteria group bacterium]